MCAVTIVGTVLKAGSPLGTLAPEVRSQNTSYKINRAFFFLSALHASLTRLRLELSVSIGKKYPLEPRSESIFDLIEGDHCLVVDPDLKRTLSLLYSNREIRQAGQTHSGPYAVPRSAVTLDTNDTPATWGLTSTE